MISILLYISSFYTTQISWLTIPHFFSGTPSNTILLKTGRASIHVPFIISMLRSYFRNSYLTVTHLSQFLVSYCPYVVSLLPVCLYVCVCVGMREHPCVCAWVFGSQRPMSGATLQLSSISLLRCGLSRKIKIIGCVRERESLAIFFPVLGL